MYVIESAGLTDVGRRKNNEDALFLDDKQQLYVVADGMGGHLAGEVASGIVVETLWDYIKRFDNRMDVEELEDPDESLSKEANRLLSGIYLANKSVYQTAQGKEDYHGMGSTIASVYFTENTLIAANVGDSPIYLVHDGTIEQLSVPHTVLAEQAALDPEGARQLGGEFRHMLTRAMGVDASVKADISEIQCFRGDILVISSDGLTDNVDKEEIHAVVKRERPEKACRILVNMANERGGRDNITVIVLKVKKTTSKSGGLFHFI
ncbi:MAG: serine/threonine-protein phosphatase [Deltaproteobacteria bacterium]|nr:serine/threonine-protein phosphatase [Deltaproteobacteria bacterium]